MESDNNILCQANIMVVDDVPENLQVLAGMLKGQGCTVRPVPSGKLALAAAKSQPPDIFLLDINMPEMDGYEVCQVLKADPVLKDIPVIFISALSETMDKVKAFQVGGVDYVTKPFQFEEVSARVRTHLELRRSNQELKTLLTRTFVGSVRTMMDILSIVNPDIFNQCNRLKRYTNMLTRYLHLDRMVGWQFEMAAMLSQIGCVTVPEEILSKKRNNENLAIAEEKIFRQHPVVASEMLGAIPRMETVAAIIARQQETWERPLQQLQTADTIELGSRILHLLVEYDYFLTSGKTPVEALYALQERYRGLSSTLLNALRFVVEQEEDQEVHDVAVKDLTSGMLLMENVVTDTGILILHKSIELSPNLVSILKQYAMNHKIKEPIKVLPRLPL